MTVERALATANDSDGFRFGPVYLSQMACLVILFCFGLVARLLVTVFFADNHSVYFEHMIIAQNILQGKGYSWDEWHRAILQPTSLVVPLYVYWCLLFEWLSPHNFLPMYAMQAVIAATGCIPAFRIGRNMFTTRIGWVFAALYTFYPEFVFMHSKAVAESMLVVAALWMIERYSLLREKPPGTIGSVRVAMQIGAISGVGMLIKETASLVAIAIMIAQLMRFRPRWSVFRWQLAPMLAVIIVIVCPWFIRNAIVQGEFVPLRTAYGINLWVSNLPGSAGNDRTVDGLDMMSNLPPAYRDSLNKVLPLDEQDRDRHYIAETYRMIKQDPAAYLNHCLVRLRGFVLFVRYHPLASNPIYRSSWILLLIFGIPGVVMASRSHRIDPVVPLIILGFLLLYVPVEMLPRYRVVPASLLMLFASVSIDRVLTVLEARFAKVRNVWN